MKAQLHISDSLSLPLELVTSTQAILARKRSGKSYCASVQAEEMLTAHQQIAVLDPTGAWHGLKSSADGQSAGFPIVVFGGEHADAPLDSSAGAMLARTMIERGFSAIFDVSLLGVAEAVRFVADFINELFRVNRDAMHLFIDEADAYAPERPFGEEMKSLAAIKRLVKQGGIKGIGVTMITQRSAQLAKSVLSQVDTLTVLRMSHPLDIASAADWISSEISPEFAAEVKKALPRLPVGTAFICSAQWNIGERVEIRKRTTFNSGATPKPGEKRIQPKVMARVDIEKLGQEIEATIQRAKEDDPKELRRQIAEFKRNMGNVVDTRESDALKQRVSELAAALDLEAKRRAHLERFRTGLLSLMDEHDLSYPQPEAAPAPVQVVINAPPVQKTTTLPPRPLTGTLNSPQARILDSLADFKAMGIDPVNEAWLAGVNGTTKRSRGFEENIRQLKANGYITKTGASIGLTEYGDGVAKIPDRAMTQAALLNALSRMLSGPQFSMLVFIVGRKTGIGAEELASLMQTTVRSRGFEENMRFLKSNELISGTSANLRAADFILRGAL